MKNVVIICGHPDLNSSVANKAILDEIAAKCPQVEIRKLCELYPDYQFDIKAEQSALEKADIIIFQYPMNRYGVPGLLKLYIDKVMEHGRAYGSQGTALEGKAFIASLTTDTVYFASATKEVVFPEHSHAAQWTIVVSGSCTFTANGESKVYSAGETYFIPAGLRHQITLHAGYSEVDYVDDPLDGEECTMENKVIAGLQTIVTELSQQADGHLIQSRIFAAQDDLTTFDILKAYYQDEEGDMYWAEQQLALIELIGKQNWLAKQF